MSSYLFSKEAAPHAVIEKKGTCMWSLNGFILSAASPTEMATAASSYEFPSAVGLLTHAAEPQKCFVQ